MARGIGKKKVTVGQISKYLFDLLKINEVEDKYCQNGLQVCRDPGKAVHKAAFAVDACLDTINAAVNQNADILIVHHGLFWPGIKQVNTENYQRLKMLLHKDLALFNVHIPLDCHPRYGNNAILARMAGSRKWQIKGFGALAELSGKQKTDAIAKRLADQLNTQVKTIVFHNRPVKRLYMVSGGGASEIHRLTPGDQVDLFVTGEPNHSLYHLAKEKEMNLIFTGHYSSETTGILSLQKLIKSRFSLQTCFLDAATGL